MKIETTQQKIQKIRLTKLNGIDPITIYVDNISKGKGRILIECWGQVWTAYWIDMGNKTVQEFFCVCDDDYLYSKIRIASRPHKEYEYVVSIIQSVRKAFQEMK